MEVRCHDGCGLRFACKHTCTHDECDACHTHTHTHTHSLSLSLSLSLFFLFLFLFFAMPHRPFVIDVVCVANKHLCQLVADTVNEIDAEVLAPLHVPCWVIHWHIGLDGLQRLVQGNGSGVGQQV